MSHTDILRIGAGVLNQTALDITGNCSRIHNAIEESKAQGIQLLCLPELCITGYGSEDMYLSEGFVGQAWDALWELADSTTGLWASVGLPVSWQGELYNCSAVIGNGKVAGLVAKQHLARDGLHYEPRWFRPWTAGKTVTLDWRGQTIPMGDLVFDLDSVRLGFEICEDAWVSDRPLQRLVKRGVNLIFNPSASHFAFGKNRVRQDLILKAVSHPKLAYVYANLLGNEAGRAIYDGDAYIAAGGEISVFGSRFSYHDHQLIACDLEFSNPAEAAKVDVIPLEKNWPESIDRPPLKKTVVAEWEESDQIKEEEFARSVALGLFDYVRKSRSQGVVISLSGGADSAAVAILSRLMIEFAWNDLGAQGVADKLSHVVDVSTPSEMGSWLKAMICSAYQATRNSSEVTRQAALDVANGCCSTHYELDIDPIVEGYKKLVAESIGRELNWKTDDIALQNIQARTRSPGIWMFANIRNALLLSTSNRSEAAVGYATMDGDTSGGLAPIAGIDKAFLRHWLEWVEKLGPVGVGPFECLNKVNQQQPTAELRPLEQHQTDEEDLMPYPVLDFIERAAVRDKLMPRQIVGRVREQFKEVSLEQTVFWIRRFFRLWCRNQWKRERYAPSFHLDEESLDPKTWCRFPILSGGFEQELQLLEADCGERQ